MMKTSSMLVSNILAILYARIRERLYFPFSKKRIVSLLTPTLYAKSFCFYISSADYYVLPKRALTYEQIALLRQLILAYVNPLLVRVKIKN